MMRLNPFRRKPKVEKKQEKPYIAKESILVTDQANLRLMTCKVHNDKTLTFGKKLVKIVDQPKVMEISSTIFPSKLVRFFVPTKIRVRVYTVQKEGEVTHDPNIDNIDTGEKRSLETLIKVQGKMMKADFAGKIAEGMRDKLDFWEMFPYIAIVLIVLFFLMAFQVAPNI